MSTHKRTPRHFPKMKVRGARRRRLAEAQRLWRKYDLLSAAAVEAVLLIKRFTDSLAVPGAAEFTPTIIVHPRDVESQQKAQPSLNVIPSKRIS